MACRQQITQLLFDQVADHALAFGIEDIQRVMHAFLVRRIL
jgi:hypothetical protein